MVKMANLDVIQTIGVQHELHIVMRRDLDDRCHYHVYFARRLSRLCFEDELAEESDVQRVNI